MAGGLNGQSLVIDECKSAMAGEAFSMKLMEMADHDIGEGGGVLYPTSDATCQSEAMVKEEFWGQPSICSSIWRWFSYHTSSSWPY